MKSILITGASGFILNPIFALLKEQNVDIHVIGRSNVFHQYNNVRFHHFDLLNTHDFKNIMQFIRPTHLIHAAWYTEHGHFWESSQNSLWVHASELLFESFYRYGGQHIIGLGSCAEYCWKNQNFHEGILSNIPASYYGKTKKKTSEILKVLAEKYGTSYIWVRVFFPYGPMDSVARFLPHVISNLMNNKSIKCMQPESIRDYIHVHDICRILVQLLDVKENAFVNLGTGHGIKMQELVEYIAYTLNKNNLVGYGTSCDTTKVVADLTVLKTLVDVGPFIDLRTGIKNLIENYPQSLMMQ